MAGQRVTPAAPRLGRRQLGQSLVELALVMPMLVALLAGALDLGRVYFAYVGIVGAARYGAQVGAVLVTEGTLDDGALEAQVRSAVVANCSASGLSVAGGDVAVSYPDAAGRARGHPVRVDVTYRFAAVTPFVNALTGGTPLAISATAAQVAN